MNHTHTRSLAILFVLVIIATLLFGAFRVFTIAGAISNATPTPTAASATPSLAPSPAPTPQYPDQTHATDGIIAFAIVLSAIIIFGVIWGRRMTIPRLPKPNKK